MKQIMLAVALVGAASSAMADRISNYDLFVKATQGGDFRSHLLLVSRCQHDHDKLACHYALTVSIHNQPRSRN